MTGRKTMTIVRRATVSRIRPYMVTETMCVGPANPLYPVRCSTIADAVERIRRLEEIAVPTHEMAEEVLVALGVDEESARFQAWPPTGPLEL